MAIDVMSEMIEEIEAENRRAAEAKAAGGNGAGFFILKDGEKALFRPLLNQFVPVWCHDVWNQEAGKMDVSAICAQSLDLPKELCKHCVTADQTKNKKLLAVKQYVVPVWLYGVKSTVTGIAKTYEKDGEKQLVRGLRYLKMKPSDPIMAFLMTAYKMEKNITLRDITVTQTGEKLTKKLVLDPRDPSTFTVQDVPVQDPDTIILWLSEKNPAAILGGPTADYPDGDPFGNAPAVISAPAVSASHAKDVPDF